MINEAVKNVKEIGKDGWVGYEITTYSHSFKLLIENGQNCCEDSGYMTSEDNLAELIGKNLESIEFTDTELNSWVIDKRGDNDFDHGGIQFITLILTNSLPVQFAVYNEHNGYYGHSIKFITERTEIL